MTEQEVMKVKLAGSILVAGVVSGKPLGAVFVREGEVILSNEYWRIALEMDVSGIPAQLERVLDRIDNFREWQRGDDGWSIYNNDYLVLLKHRVHELIKKAKGVRAILPGQRGKRGLVDIGGKALKFLFGTPDSEDLRDIHKRLADVQSRGDEVVHFLEEQLTLVSALKNNSNINSERIVSLTERVMGLAKAEGEFAAQTDAALNNLYTKVDGGFQKIAFLGHLELALDTIREEIDDLVEGLGEVALGRLSPIILSPQELLDIMMEAGAGMAPGVDWLTPLRLEEMYHYYEWARVGASASPDSLVVVIDIPLRRDEYVYDIFRLAVVPVETDIAGVSVVLNSTVSALLVRRDRLLYSAVDREYIRSCRGLSVRVCSTRIALSFAVSESCEFAIFRAEEALIHKLCRWTVTIGQKAHKWVPLGGNTDWLYSVPNDTRVLTICDGVTGQESSVVSRFSGVGLFYQPPSCEVRTDYNVLRRYSTRTTYRNTSRGDVVIPDVRGAAHLDWSLGHSRESIEAVLKELRADQASQGVPVEQVSLQALKAKLASLSSRGVSYDNETLWWSTVAVAFLAGVGTASMWLLFCYERYWRPRLTAEDLGGEDEVAEEAEVNQAI